MPKQRKAIGITLYFAINKLMKRDNKTESKTQEMSMTCVPANTIAHKTAL